MSLLSTGAARWSVLALLLIGLAGASARAQALRVGDPAPALELGEVLRGEPIDRLEPGRAYVVDFWASWCSACVESMPGLSRLQRDLGPKGLTVIGVNVLDDPAHVVPFLEGSGDYAAGDKMMHYTVAIEEKIGATDPKRTGRMTESWLRASGQKAVPVAFLVDRDGTIAWIGHPNWPTGELREFAEHVADGTLSDATARELRRKWNEIGALSNSIHARSKSGDYDGALAAIARLDAINPQGKANIAVAKFEILLMGLRSPDRAYAFAREAMANELADDAWKLNVISWYVVDEPDVPERDYDFAIEAATRACEITDWQDPAILDTLAKAYYDSGQRERGFELQEKAVARSVGTRWERELTKRFERYRREMGKTDEKGKRP